MPCREGKDVEALIEAAVAEADRLGKQALASDLPDLNALIDQANRWRRLANNASLDLRKVMYPRTPPAPVELLESLRPPEAQDRRLRFLSLLLRDPRNAITHVIKYKFGRTNP
jgi:hypothetical protein